MASIYGNNIIVSIFGQSHSKAIGVTINNLPPGFEIDMEKLENFMKRRSSTGKAYATKRKEPDKVEIVSGLINNKTCGAPLTALIFNSDFRPQDYSNLKNVPRPGHADYPAFMKFKNFQDPTGGGHFSGRITAALSIAGAISKQILEKKGIDIYTHVQEIHGIKDEQFNPLGPTKEQTNSLLSNSFPVINKEAGQKMEEAILKASDENDSLGGIIECIVTNLPPGIGEPIFDGLENNIAKAIFGVPAVKGIEFGNGFFASKLKGSQNNDAYHIKDNQVRTKTNNHGGILGGISTGMPLIFRVAIKPTSSIGLVQDSVNLDTMENEKLLVSGRHDPCITPRAVPAIEAACAVAVLDMFMSYKIWR